MDITPQLISAILLIVSLVVGASTAYLRLFVSKEIAKVRDEIIEKLSQRYQPKELTEEKLANMRLRVQALEQQLGDVRRRRPSGQPQGQDDEP